MHQPLPATGDQTWYDTYLVGMGKLCLNRAKNSVTQIGR